MSDQVSLHCGVCAKEGPMVDPSDPDPSLGDWVLYAKGALVVCPDCEAHQGDEPLINDRVRYVSAEVRTGTVTSIGKGQIDVVRIEGDDHVSENVFDYPRWVLADDRA